MMLSYVTDIEGRWDKLTSFLDGNPHVSLVDGALRIADGVTFVFGGDAVDRGAHGRRFVDLLVAAKRSYGDRVILLAGNRDINKLRLRTELGGQPRRNAPTNVSRGELLRWTLANTMGAGKAFEHRVTELRDLGLPTDDDAVVDSYLADIAPGGGLREYLEEAQLGFRAGETLFLHGGVTPENFLAVPGMPRARDVDQWLANLATFYATGMLMFDTGTRPEALIAYQAQGPDKLNQGSVVYARPTDELGNPHLPPREIVRELLDNGIRRVVVGHTPSGDCPAILRDGDFELVLADNSYGRLERGSQIAIVACSAGAQALVRGATQLDDGTQAPIEFASTPDDDALGRRDATGRLIKARLADGRYLTFRGMPKYQVEQLAVARDAFTALTSPYDGS